MVGKGWLADEDILKKSGRKNMIRFAERTTNMNSSAVREILKLVSQPDIVSFGGGCPAPELFPLEEVAGIAKQVVIENGRQALQYSATEGLVPLREKILNRMQSLYGIQNMTMDNIALLSGSQQGLDLMAKTLVNPGDVIFVEMPTYLGALNAFAPYEPEIVSIQMDEEGMVIEDLEKKLKQYPNAKFIYTIPDFQNPTGCTMSSARRKEFLKAVAPYDVMVLEDNPYGELRYEGRMIPPLKAFDTNNQVVYLGTFSKILSPGLRMGWVLGDSELVRKWVTAKQSSDLQCNTLSQYMINAYMDTYDLSGHISALRDVYGRRQQLMLRSLEKYMPKGVTWTHPEGGLFIWLTFPENVDASQLLEICVKNHVAYVPGEPFTPDHGCKNNCRLNFSYISEDDLVAGIKNMRKSLEEYR